MVRRWSVVAGLLLISAACTGGSTPVPSPSQAAVPVTAARASGAIVRSSPTPTHHAPTPRSPLMHIGRLTYATEAGIFEMDPQTHRAKQIVRGSVTSFAWAPDGSVLAYVVEPHRGCEIWVHDMASGGHRKLTGCGGTEVGGQQLDWSPDGTHIAFVMSGRVHVINADGSHERSLRAPSGVTSVSWSPDGTMIVYENGGSIGVVGSDGSSPRRIAYGSWPTWSPDGRTIAFLLDPRKPSPGPGYHYPWVLQIWTVHLDGSRPERVAQSPDCCLNASPTLGWSPDGSMLVLTGVSFKIVQADGSGTKAIHVPATLSVRPSWRPAP